MSKAFDTDDVHLGWETYFSHSSSPTGPPITKPTPFDRGHPNAVVWAEFRDLYRGRRELFESAVVADPIHFGKIMIKMKKMKKMKKIFKSINNIMQHLIPRTYFSHSASPTHSPELKPAPVDSQDPNAVVWAEFRDLYQGSRKLFDLA
jgi:hypothetical protein